MEPVITALLFATIAGLSTGIGGVIAYFLKDTKLTILSVLMGFAAGVMIYISFAKLLRQSIAGIGFLKANIFFFGGIGVIFLIDKFVPHTHLDTRPDSCEDAVDRQRLMQCGVLTAVGIAIHNFPEGIAVFSASLKSLSLGLPVMIAIALHNIPEGISVSVPIYYATGDEKKAFGYSLFSGLVEPLGAVLAYIVLFKFLSPQILGATLATVAGIMVFISFDELIPVSKEYGSEHLSNLGLFLGMVLMAMSLYLL